MDRCPACWRWLSRGRVGPPSDRDVTALHHLTAKPFRQMLGPVPSFSELARLGSSCHESCTKNFLRLASLDGALEDPRLQTVRERLTQECYGSQLSPLKEERRRLRARSPSRCSSTYVPLQSREKLKKPAKDIPGKLEPKGTGKAPRLPLMYRDFMPRLIPSNLDGISIGKPQEPAQNTRVARHPGWRDQRCSSSARLDTPHASGFALELCYVDQFPRCPGAAPLDRPILRPRLRSPPKTTHSVLLSRRAHADSAVP